MEDISEVKVSITDGSDLIISANFYIVISWVNWLQDKSPVG